MVKSRMRRTQRAARRSSAATAVNQRKQTPHSDPRSEAERLMAQLAEDSSRGQALAETLQSLGMEEARKASKWFDDVKDLLRRTDLTSDELGSRLVEIYQNVVPTSEVRTLASALPVLSKVVARDLGIAFTATTAAYLAIRTDPNYISAIEQRATQFAEERKRAVDIYSRAGFSRAEAISFVIQDDVSFNEAIRQMLSFRRP
jgi:hypothetical protein